MAIVSKGSFQWTGAGNYIQKVVSDFDMFQMYNMGSSAGSVWNNSTANPGVIKMATFFKGMPLGTALAMKNTNAAATDSSIFIASGGFTPLDTSNPPTFAIIAVTAITAASPAQVTAAAHGLQVGDSVRLTQINNTMASMSGHGYTVDSIVDANNFTITFDASDAGAGRLGNVPATAGFMQKFIPNYFQPRNLTIGPSTTSGSVAANGTSLLVNLNEGPNIGLGGITAPPAGSVAYQPGAYLRINVPPNFGLPPPGALGTMNGLIGQITSVNKQANYAVANQLTLQLVGATTAAGLGALNWPVGVANFRSSFPFVSDIAEIATILTEAEDNVGYRGMIFGPSLFAAATTNPSTVFWIATKADSVLG